MDVERLHPCDTGFEHHHHSVQAYSDRYRFRHQTLPGALAGEQAGVGGFAIRDRRTRQLASEQFASPGTDGKHVALRVQNEIVQWDIREEPTLVAMTT